MTERDRWKCPECGKITVDPTAPIAACACGCEEVQMRQFPYDDDWEPPEWPEWSDYSPDPYENESFIIYAGENTTYREPATEEDPAHE